VKTTLSRRNPEVEKNTIQSNDNNSIKLRNALIIILVTFSFKKLAAIKPIKIITPKRRYKEMS
jgi:hypothetical protein